MNVPALKTLISISATALMIGLLPHLAAANTCSDFFQSNYMLFQPLYANSRYDPNEHLNAEVESLILNSLTTYNRIEQRWEQPLLPSRIADGVYNFIIDQNLNLRIGSEDLGIHHGHLAHGEAVLGFGKVYFHNGRIVYMLPHSGLYYQSAKEQTDLHSADFNVFVLQQIANILRKQDPFANYDISSKGLQPSMQPALNEN